MDGRGWERLLENACVHANVVYMFCIYWYVRKGRANWATIEEKREEDVSSIDMFFFVFATLFFDVIHHSAKSINSMAQRAASQQHANRTQKHPAVRSADVRMWRYKGSQMRSFEDIRISKICTCKDCKTEEISRALYVYLYVYVYVYVYHRLGPMGKIQVIWS